MQAKEYTHSHRRQDLAQQLVRDCGRQPVASRLANGRQQSGNDQPERTFNDRVSVPGVNHRIVFSAHPQRNAGHQQGQKATCRSVCCSVCKNDDANSPNCTASLATIAMAVPSGPLAASTRLPGQGKTSCNPWFAPGLP